MSASFAHPPFMPCPECGASVAVAAEAVHVCNPDRRVDYELFQLRAETARLDAEIEDYFSSPTGRFEQWYAEHDRGSNRAEEREQPGDEPG
jgi:hypothetical protein